MLRSLGSSTLGLLLALAAPFGQALAQGSIQIPAEVLLEDARLRLGRIAVFEDVPAEIERELRELALGPAADPSEVRVLGGASLRAQIRRIAPQLQANIPDTIRITRLHREISPEWVQARIHEAVQLRMPWREAEISLAGWSLPSRFAVPANATGLRVVFGQSEDFQGRVTARLEFFDPTTPDHTEIARTASLEVQLERPILVASRDLRRGERAETRLFRMEKRNPRRVPSDALVEDTLIEGLPLRVDVQAGTPLRLSYFDTPELVRRGDALEVSTETPGLEIRISARALQAGAFGEIIRAENPVSRRSFPVRLTGPGTALLLRAGGVR